MPELKLAVVVATKDRPEKLRNLLASLSEQTPRPDLVVIGSAGVLIDEVINKFADRLSIVHKHLEEAGQVGQRNCAIQLVPNDFDLIGCIDDDITFERNSIQAMLDFWTTHGSEVIGAGFNITNMPSHRFRRWLSWCGMSAEEPGRVLSCGTPTSITNVKTDIQSQWLNGGTTVWRRKVLSEILHSPIKTSWAVYEDLIFSYPLRESGEMWIVSKAKVGHDDDGEDGLGLKKLIFRAKQHTFWRFIFVSVNSKSLSLGSWFLRVLFDCCIGLIKIPVTPKKGVARLTGTLIGAWGAVKLFVSGRRGFRDYYDDSVS